MATTLNLTVNASPEAVWHSLTQPEAIKRWVTNPGRWRCTDCHSDFLEGGYFTLQLIGESGGWSASVKGHFGQIKPYQSVTFSIDGGQRAAIMMQVAGSQVACQCTLSGATQLASGHSHNVLMQRFKDYTEKRFAQQQ
ncbi:SRPBCC family protein [Salinimonas sediminis]|uniref:SRPBCC family protein n=1 Tax=Salinimonas sediminis TaxID=2303538 RepID=UPI001472BB63|nr:SRPBCC domain-containing protein [Salinimonas sediminis]